MAPRLEVEDTDAVLVGSIPKGRNEEVRLSLREFRGTQFIDFRSFYEIEGKWRPSHKGVTIPPDAYPDLRTSSLSWAGPLGTQ